MSQMAQIYNIKLYDEFKKTINEDELLEFLIEKRNKYLEQDPAKDYQRKLVQMNLLEEDIRDVAKIIIDGKVKVEILNMFVYGSKIEFDED